MNKKTKRIEMLSQLNRMGRSEHEELSRAIAGRVIASEEFLKADTIGMTISRFPEVNTRPIIEEAWKMGKRVAVPKCISSTRAMDFREITSFDHLETVYYGLLEPIVEVTEPVGKDEIDLQVVPGVVFSDNGFRIGFGGGYYDRYMADFKGDSFALAFDCQTGHSVPTEDHDIPVPKIFTETAIIDCKKIGKRK